MPLLLPMVLTFYVYTQDKKFVVDEEYYTMEERWVMKLFDMMHYYLAQQR